MIRFASKIVLVMLAARELAFLHHGHIVMFLTDVRERVLRGDPACLSGAKTRREPSKLELHFGDPDAQHYIVAVHRKTRSLEVGLHFEGDAAENQRFLRLLADRASTLRSQLGPNVELEQWTRSWTRVHDSVVLSAPGDWSPKRDLTPAVVERTANRLLAFVRVLQPILRADRKNR